MILKPLPEGVRNNITRANAVSERKKSLKNFDVFSFAVWTNVKRKRASDDEKNQEHRNIAPLRLQPRSYNNTFWVQSMSFVMSHYDLAFENQTVVYCRNCCWPKIVYKTPIEFILNSNLKLSLTTNKQFQSISWYSTPKQISLVQTQKLPRDLVPFQRTHIFPSL